MRHRACHLGFVGGSRLGLLCLSPNGSGFQRRPVEINRDSEDGYFKEPMRLPWVCFKWRPT
jgi:hypothetical protein